MVGLQVNLLTSIIRKEDLMTRRFSGAPKLYVLLTVIL